MAPQDSFIDDDDDSCPLCVEEFDLSDKNFRPCPCGYQVCQFCYNNIKNNMNGLCPACRRPYDEKTIEWKVVTPEEVAQFKANIQKNAKKKQEQRQKEAQKREVESLNRKHLSGLRVVQKNLVYVVGLSPGIPEQEILQTLRGDKYFGQYGKIIKIVVSNKKTDTGPNGQSLGVYVTFARKEDAARCIAAVNGSQNGDRVLRAQLGTTKYCSAYLRNEICTNKNCMFLHEPGDNDDSYSRQDLSSINSVNTQRPLPTMASSSRQVAQAQAPIQQIQPAAAAAQPMARENSKDGSDSGDGSALPSSASWANRGVQQRSRRGSHATSGAASSPAVSHAMPATAEAVEDNLESTLEQPPEPASVIAASDTANSVEAPRPEGNPVLLDLLKAIISPNLSFFGSSTTADNSEAYATFPPLFDDRGGEKRRAMREHQEEARLHLDQDSQADLRSVTEPVEEEEQPESGSLQLGGEPEDRDNGRESNLPQGFHGARRPSTQLPIQRASNGGPFGPSLSQNFPQNLSNLNSINGRTLTPMQQQQLLLMKSGQPQSGFMDQFPPGMGSQLGQGSALFQQQGHNRQSSRYSFANDSASASANIKPSANAKLMAQQSSMMPSGSHVQQGSQFYGSSMPGPPPGLKSSGTPPIAGGMFSQGHNFGGSMGGTSAFGGLPKDNGSDMLRDMLRGRGATGGGQSHDTGKHELGLPSLDEATFSVDALVADIPFDEFIGFDHPSRSSTPSVPPGFGFLPTQPSAVPGEEAIAKPTSRIVPTSAPFTPSRSASFYPRAATPLSNVSVPATPRAAPSSMGETPTSQAKQEVQQLASSSGLSKAIASQASQPALQSEDFPALQTSKGKTPITLAAVKSMSSAKSGALPATTKKQSAALGTAPSTQQSAKGADKRAASGLNISVPAKAKASATVSAPPDLASKPVVVPAAFPPLPTSTIAPSIQSPLARNVAKSLRVTATPKTETPSGGSATPTSVTSMFPPTFPPSRQASLASVSRLDRPGSPTSEAVSDNASITSASMSRASSPPLTKVGSAPVRATTKSMQKKQRKEAQKEKERTEIEATVNKVEPEVEIAPIMGRKKKQKKDRSLNTATGGSTPTASRPQSPTPTESAAEESRPSVDIPQQSAEASVKQISVEAETEALVRTTGESKGKSKTKAQQSALPEALSMAEVEEEASDKPIPTAISIFQDLVKSGALGDVNTLSLLRQPSYSYRHQETPIDMQSANQKLTITPEDREALLNGRPVHKVKEGPHRIMLTPNGDCVRNLTPEEERRYLELQARLTKANGPTAFYSAKHHASNGFTLIGGRAVPNGPPSFFPALNSTNTPMDPVSKIQRDEALSYINQYVLPSLSTNSQLEKALNANAFETEILRSGDASAWATWGTDPATPHPTNNDAKYVNREGILANGLESMTAHFAVGGDINRSQTLGNVCLLSLSDAETAFQVARKETEGFEKKLHALIKKNRRLLLGSGS